MVYLITYDLNCPRQEYEKLYETIKNFGPWWHHLDSTWLVDTNLSSQEITDRLESLVLDEDDYLLVIRVTRDYQGLLKSEAWDWINQRVI